MPLQTIPATLQEALLARPDRLSDARQIAQLGATLGREFSYELLRAVAPIAEADLQTALTKLVEAEILFQRGVGQQSRYFFKHALIQDTAYQSLLKSTRQRYHQQIARALEEQFPETKEAQPELLAHHYSEAGLIEQAIPYWQRAGQHASQCSANTEASSHLNRALGNTMYFLGDLLAARFHLERAVAIYDPRQDYALAIFYVVDPAVSAGSYGAWTLWFLGYPDQALKKSHNAIVRAQELSHVFSLGIAQVFAAALY